MNRTLSPAATNRHLISDTVTTPAPKSMTMSQSGKSSLMSCPDLKIIPQTNKNKSRENEQREEQHEMKLALQNNLDE